MTIEKTTDDYFDAMLDSVNLINSTIALGIVGIDSVDLIDRNCAHLEFMCNQPNIIQDGRSLLIFQEAIDNGKAFIGIEV